MADSTTLDVQAAVRLQRSAGRLTAKIAGTAQTLAAAIRSARVDLATIGAERDLTVGAKLARSSARREQLQATVDEVEATTLGLVGEVEALAAASLEPSGDPQVQLLHEQRLARAWARIVRLLDAGQDPMTIATRAVDGSSPITFAALAAELPDWMRAKGSREDDIATVMTALREMETPLLSAAEAMARQVVEDAKQAAYWVRTNVGTVRVDGENTTLLVASKSETIQVGDAAA